MTMTMTVAVTVTVLWSMGHADAATRIGTRRWDIFPNQYRSNIYPSQPLP